MERGVDEEREVATIAIVTSIYDAPAEIILRSTDESEAVMLESIFLWGTEYYLPDIGLSAYES